MESGYYPPGAENDPNAPYNQIDNDPRSFEVSVVTTLSKNTSVETSDYTQCVDEDEDGKHLYYEFDNVCWNAEYEQQHRSVLELLGVLREELQNKLERTTDPSEVRRINYLISECEGWGEDDLEIIHEAYNV